MPNNVWFWSDPHFDHTKVIKYCKRPFVNEGFTHAYGDDSDERDFKRAFNTEEMNKTLVQRLNEKVHPQDTLYLLGDLCFSNHPEKYLEQVNGRKHLILGNHDDRHRLEKTKLFESVEHYAELNLNHPTSGQKLFLVLFHYPIARWNKSHYGSYHLHGHSHGSYNPPHGKIMDVGVDTNNYYPYSLLDVCAFMDMRQVVNDHHNE